MKKPINEIKKMQRLAGLITESEYQESLMNEASSDEVPLSDRVKKFIDKAVASAKKDGEFENLMDAEWFDNELIDELIDLFPNKDYDRASKEVMDYISQVTQTLSEDKENIVNFLNANTKEFISKLGNPGSKFENLGDPKVATAGKSDTSGIDVSFDREHMLKLFPKDDPYNKVEEIEIAGKKIYYNDYR